jgi:uncharacterized repeat protein (TIGR01451 family)
VRRLALAALVLALAAAVGGVALAARAQVPPTPGVVVDKVEICHSPPAPKRQEVSVDSIIKENGHGSHPTDIIPPFTYDGGTYPGKNWDLAGQATWYHDCDPANVPKVTPTLECVESGPGGLVAHFGYRNDGSGTANIPVSLVNMFVPSPENRGQPVAFETGTHADVFSVPFSGSLEWVLAGKSVTADSNSPVCQASIRIDKAVAPNPDTDPGRFDLLLDGKAFASGVGNGGTTGAQVVNASSAGTEHTVSERAAAGTDLGDYSSAIVCRDEGGNTVKEGQGTSLTVTVKTGQAIVCVITNTRSSASIRIDKALVPATDPGRFDLLLDGKALAKGVGNGGSTGVQVVTASSAGTQHTVSERAAAGTDLGDYGSAIVCRDEGGNTVKEGQGTSLTVTVKTGQAIVCVITNTRSSATIKIDKALVPATDPGRFDLLLDGTALAKSVGNGGTTGVQVVKASSAGTQHTVSERAASGTDLGDYISTTVCHDQGGAGKTVKQGKGTSLTLTVKPGQAIVCVITNTRRTASIKIDKAVVPTTDPGRFDLLLDGTALAKGVGNGGTTGVQVVTASSAGTQHTVSEQAAAGTDLGDYSSTIVCRDQDGNTVKEGEGTSLTLTVEPGEALVCVITNTRGSASIRIDKTVVPATDPGRFDLLLDGTALAKGVGNGGTTGTQVVNASSAGTQHTVSERAAAGTNTNLRDYDSEIVCRDRGGAGKTVKHGDGTSLTLTVKPGQAIVCVITNTRRTASIKIDKAVVPATDPGRFDLLLDGRALAKGVGNGGTTGVQVVTASAAGTRHTVSERAAAGTSTNLGDYVSAIACRDHDGNTVKQGEGTSLTLTVKPGQALVCVITNTRRSSGEADLKVVKSASPPSVLVGEQVTWTVTVTNKGPDTATNVVVDDSLPSDVSYVDGSLDVPANVTCVGARCTIPSLAVGASVTGRFVTTATAVGEKTNTVTVDADQDDPHPADNSASAQVLVTGHVEPKVTPILECVEPLAGSVYRAHFGYLNQGAEAVTVPVGADNAFTPAPEDRGQPTRFEPGRAPDVFQVDFEGTIAWTLAGHTVTASGSSDRCASSSGTLRIDKLVEPTSDPGRFNLEIDGVPAGTGRNVGHLGTTGDVAVTAGRHRVGEEGVNGTSLADYDTTIVCRGDAGLGPPTSAFEGPELVVDVPAGATVVCTMVNSRRAQPSPEPPPSPPLDPTPLPPPPPGTADLAVRKSVDRPIASVGDIVTWTVLVVNNGPETATGVTITDAKAAGATFVSLTVPQGTCAPPTCSLGTIPPGGSVRIVARTRADKTGAFLNTVVVRGDQPDTIPENNVGSALLRVNESFHPPLEERCGNLSIDRQRTVAGTAVNVRAGVENVFGAPLARTVVSARGAGLRVTARTNRHGVAVLRVAPTRAGLVQFTVAARTLNAAGAERCTTVLSVKHAVGGVPPGRPSKPAPGRPGKPSPGRPSKPAPGRPSKPSPGRPSKPAPGRPGKPAPGPGARPTPPAFAG